MPYHAHDSENHIITCPDCGSTFVHPVNETDTLYNGHYKGMESDLYQDLGADYSREYNEEYEHRYGYKALRRQNHFFCEPCMDWHQEYEGDPSYVPIFPYKDMGRIHVDDIKYPKPPENPYKSFFE